MEPMTIFAISGCLLTAGMVYVVLQVRHFGEKQVVSDELLKAQTETAKVNKTLQGYTRYGEHLDAGRQALVAHLKPPVAKVTREYVHVAHLPKELIKLAADVTVIITYKVDFSFGLDLSASGLEVIHAANGVGLKMSRPMLIDDPAITLLSHQVVSTTPLADEKPVLDDAHAKFVVLARRYGQALCSEETLRQMCKMKALECLRDSLAKQPGVQHVPGIFVDFM